MWLSMMPSLCESKYGVKCLLMSKLMFRFWNHILPCPVWGNVIWSLHCMTLLLFSYIAIFIQTPRYYILPEVTERLIHFHIYWNCTCSCKALFHWANGSIEVGVYYNTLSLSYLPYHFSHMKHQLIIWRLIQLNVLKFLYSFCA